MLTVAAHYGQRERKASFSEPLVNYARDGFGIAKPFWIGVRIFRALRIDVDEAVHNKSNVPIRCRLVLFRESSRSRIQTDIDVSLSAPFSAECKEVFLGPHIRHSGL